MAKAIINGIEINKFIVDGGGSCNIFAEIGYEETPQIIEDGIEYAKEIQANWDASVTAKSFSYQFIIYFPLVDTSNLKSMSSMFYGTPIQCVPKNLITSNVTNMYSTFGTCKALTTIDISSWDTSNVTRMEEMFYGSDKLLNVTMSNLDLSKLTNMKAMFSGCTNLKTIDMNDIKTSSSLANLSSVFYNCMNLNELYGLDNLNTSNVTDMKSMFYQCKSLTSLDLSNWDTSNVTDMSYMFSTCGKLTSLDLSNFDTSKVTNMKSMFYTCTNLKQLKWNNFGNGSGYTSMLFDYSSNLGVGYEDDLKNTFVHNSFDRASAGYPTCSIDFTTTTTSLFSDEDIATMTSKGYSIV